MNKRTISFTLLALFIAVGILFILTGEDPRESADVVLVEEKNESPSNSSIEKKPELSAEEQELLQQFTPEEVENLKYSHQAAQAANQNVIFYGQCIDQDGTPIKDVQVEAKVTKMRKSMVAVVATESFKYHEQLSALTDETGRFEFKAKGSYLLLEKIKHPDYLDARGPESLDYQFGQILYGNAMAGMHQPDRTKEGVKRRK
jgi:hypothetical protein